MIADVRPDLVPTDEELAAALELLEPAYDDYVENVSTERMAIGRKAAAFIYALCAKHEPYRKVDFGSGFTSYILRLFGGPVVSVDDNPEWLQKTADFLTKYGLSTKGMRLIDDYKPGRFDFIVYDYAGGDTRNEKYGWVCDQLEQGGLVYFDDAHHEGHQHRLKFECEERKFDCFGLALYTQDEYGRYGALGAPHPVPTLADLYRTACETPSDINEHLPTFVQIVLDLDAKKVIELGTRGGVSTIAWLYALQGDRRLWSVDIDPAPELPYEHWTFIQGDDLDPGVVGQLPQDADVVFIDTSHAYEQTVAELNVYRWRVRPGGKIVLHDSMLEKPWGLRNQPAFPVRSAVAEFCADENLQWTNYTNNNGLAVIEIPE